MDDPHNPSAKDVILLRQILADLRTWEEQSGRTCGRVHVSPTAMQTLKRQTLVVPCDSYSLTGYERIPGVRAVWLEDRNLGGAHYRFQPINEAQP